MAFAVKDRVKEISSTTGTGSLTLGGAVTGYQSFNAALSNGDTTYYVIENPNTSEWETGVGTFTSPSTLARTTVLSSSTGSAVSFTAGAKNVFISLPATQFPAANTTVVGTDATQTLTNKSISGASNTVTNVSLTTGVTGTLPVANGGTGVTSSTGTGSVVLSASPTFTGTVLGTGLKLNGNPPTAGQLSSVGSSGGVSLALTDNVNNSLYVKHASGFGGAQIGTDSGGGLAICTNGFTAAISISPAQVSTFAAALNYGGVTLSNSVTGTGSMVLSASPTFTGTGISVAPTSVTNNILLGSWAVSADYGFLSFSNSLSAATSIGIGGKGSGDSNLYLQVPSGGKFKFYGAGSASGTEISSAGALTYGGVTLSNSVTGTGSMVLSASPTFTGTVLGAATTFTGAITSTLSGAGFVANNATTPYFRAYDNVRAMHIGVDTSDTTNSAFLLTTNGFRLLTSAGTTIALTVTAAGGATFLNSISAGTSVNAAAASGYLLGGIPFAQADATYTYLKDPGANIVYQFRAAEAYVKATSHIFQSAGGAATFATLNASALTLSVPLNYGGVTLSNSVTGTGSMVLSASPTFTGNLTVSVANPNITLTNSSVSSSYVRYTSNTRDTWLAGNSITTASAFDWYNETDAATRMSLSEAGALSVGQPVSGGSGSGLNITGALGNPPTTGTTRTGILEFYNNTDTGMISIGIRASGAGAWIQSHDSTQTGQYPLQLNPSGGGVTVGSALTYGGVTLSNSVTGTGSMVLSASPTLTTAVYVTGGNAALRLGDAGEYLNINRDAPTGEFFYDSAQTTYAGHRFKVTGTTVLSILANGITFAQPLTYGGVTLANSVTGTGSMVLSTSISNYLSGLTLSTAGSSATFSVAAGTAMDATNASAMVLTSALSKTTSAWAVGNANGALDTGAIANSTWYSVWEIMRTDTGVVDVLISTSATAPTMPASYNRKRRIGWIKTNGSAQWFSFLQIGDDFFYAQTTEASYGATQGATLTTLSMVPPSVVPYMSGYASSVNNTATSITIAPASNSALSVIIAYSANGAGTGIYEQFGVSLVAQTNSSRQIYVAVPAMSNGGTISSSGWNDSRGKDG